MPCFANSEMTIFIILVRLKHERLHDGHTAKGPVDNFESLPVDVAVKFSEQRGLPVWNLESFSNVLGWSVVSVSQTRRSVEAKISPRKATEAMDSSSRDELPSS
jgi:hypothetical protein